MSKVFKPTVPKITGDTNTRTDEFETKFFAKSGSPKTIKETIQLALNLFFNLFS